MNIFNTNLATLFTFFLLVVSIILIIGFGVGYPIGWLVEQFLNA